MHSIVLIKQVPETGDVKMDRETGVMIREGVQSVINPLDLYGIELAIRLKEEHGGTITVCTMGPKSAGKALREALAMGCDDAVLVSDRRFAGSDTWSTSYTLAAAIRKIGAYDLVIAGERATDGDTGQVGPGVAAWLDVPLATYVSRVDQVADGAMVVERLVEEGYQVLRTPLPALLTVVKEIGAPRLPTLRGKKRARRQEIPIFSTENMELDEQALGLKGSPTRVVRITTPKVTRGGTQVVVQTEDEIDEAVEAMIGFLERRELL